MKKRFLTFYVGDGSARESNSVYYSKLVITETKEDAIRKHAQADEEGDPADYDAIEMVGEYIIE